MTVSATLPGASEGATLLAVSFEVENQKASHDMFIRINGQTNRLTGINHTYANGNTQFNYLVTMKEDGTVFIRMGKGHYILKNFETWTGMAQPLEKTEQLYSQAVTLIGGTTATYGGDGITGVVSAERDGYLITSIPYDENFCAESGWERNTAVPRKHGISRRKKSHQASTKLFLCTMRPDGRLAVGAA